MFDESPLQSGGLLILASRKSLWQHRAMIEFHTLPDDHPDLAQSPVLRAALLTLRYAQEHGAIGLTKTMAFKRVFVHWAVEYFDWPRKRRRGNVPLQQGHQRMRISAARSSALPVAHAAPEGALQG